METSVDRKAELEMELMETQIHKDRRQANLFLVQTFTAAFLAAAAVIGATAAVTTAILSWLAG